MTTLKDVCEFIDQAVESMNPREIALDMFIEAIKSGNYNEEKVTAIMATLTDPSADMNKVSEDIKALDTESQISQLAKMFEAKEKQEKSIESQIEEDYMRAYEETPQFFFPVSMIYVPIIINDEYITAFVDTGAQVSIMNYETAVRCGLAHRIDTKAQGTVVGVGTQKALGYVYHVELIIGDCCLPCNFMILQNAPNIIIGLNVMKAHSIVLDIGQEKMTIGHMKHSVDFLQSKDVSDPSFDAMKAASH